MPLKLRQQFKLVVSRRINPTYADKIHLSVQARTMAELLFMEGEVNSRDACITRRVCKLLNDGENIPVDTPGLGCQSEFHPPECPGTSDGCIRVHR